MGLDYDSWPSVRNWLQTKKKKTLRKKKKKRKLIARPKIDISWNYKN